MGFRSEAISGLWTQQSGLLKNASSYGHPHADWIEGLAAFVVMTILVTPICH